MRVSKVLDKAIRTIDYDYKKYGINPTKYGYGVFKNGKLMIEFSTEKEAREWIDEKEEQKNAY